MVKSSFVPHQLHLTREQQKKLGSGLNVNLKHSQMGADKGDSVILLKPQNARKLLTSYKKGKGMRLSLSPDELEETKKSGSGFFQFTHKVLGLSKREAVGGLKEVMKPVAGVLASIAGEAIGEAMGDPLAGEMIGYALSEGSETLIDSLAPAKGKSGLKFDANYDEKQMRKDIEKETRDKMNRTIETTLPPEMRPIAKEAVDKHITTVIEAQASPTPTVQTPAKIDYGFGIKKVSSMDMEKKKMLEKMGVKFKKGGKIHLVDVVDNPVVRPVLDAASDRAVRAIEGSGSMFRTAMMMGNPSSVNGSGIAKKVLERSQRDQRMLRGMGAKMSAPYKQAMKYNKDTYGLEVGGFSTDNAPVSKFSTNPRVKPSSTEMTLSPYQNITSPAMNPFVPKTYQQEGGVSCGYGGRGLYAGGLYAGGLGQRAERRAKDRLLSLI